ILTNVEQEAAVRELLPEFPRENIVAEPAKRDTAAAIALGVGWVAARDHMATMVVLPADHVIKDTGAFQETLRAAAAAAQTGGALVTIGIKPTWACPGFGYIEQGKRIESLDTGVVHHVVRFREKPNVDLAETFIRQGNFRWNAGMFVWTVPSVLSEFNRHTPELAHFISKVSTRETFQQTLAENFSELPKISFDYAIMEKADRVLMVEATFDWDDVGGWQAMAAYFAKDDDGNATKSPVTAIDSTDNIVFADDGSKIALLGVHNLIIVRTGDALLVCDRHEAEKIKTLIGKLPAELQ
ncbi:MAG: sugar phosphate nucleotidyltransferase, partial [Verrucomicrobiota bacterium]|nr:sugar phosphate nucleotidyltransferase [Verrucomicrobiota bacterium]